MSNKLVMRIAVIALPAGGLCNRYEYFWTEGQKLQCEGGRQLLQSASVTAQPAAGFAKSEELDVTDKLELAAPTAVKVLQTKIVEDKTALNIS